MVCVMYNASHVTPDTISAGDLPRRFGFLGGCERYLTTKGWAAQVSSDVRIKQETRPKHEEKETQKQTRKGEAMSGGKKKRGKKDT